MNVTKKYHFYAAHRNEYLEGKCRNLHGHTYYVSVKLSFNEIKDDGVTMLFEDIDKLIEPIIKELDHSTIINRNDHDLLKALEPLDMKLVVLETISSAEYICLYIYNKIYESNLPVTEVTLQETTSSIVSYP